MRSLRKVYDIKYRIFREYQITHTKVVTRIHRPLARFRLNLSQGGAAHFIDGASRNFSGRLALYRQGWLVYGGRSASIQLRQCAYKMLDAMDLSGTNGERDTTRH